MCIINRRALLAYSGLKECVQTFLPSALHWDYYLASYYGIFAPMEWALGLLNRGWMDLRAFLDAFNRRKKKNSHPCRQSGDDS